MTNEQEARKEGEEVNSTTLMTETVVRTERNNCGIQIKRCCASCAFKVIKVVDTDCIRCCTQTDQTVEGSDYCEQWQMAEGLKNLGRRRGVVRDIVTKEVILK